jgi:hypothetical protein
VGSVRFSAILFFLSSLLFSSLLVRFSAIVLLTLFLAVSGPSRSAQC